MFVEMLTDGCCMKQKQTTEAVRHCSGSIKQTQTSASFLQASKLLGALFDKKIPGHILEHINIHSNRCSWCMSNKMSEKLKKNVSLNICKEDMIKSLPPKQGLEPWTVRLKA